MVAITEHERSTMPPITTASRYPDAWHNAEHDRERAWLDDWVRGRISAATLEVPPAHAPADTVPALTTAGSR